MSAKPKKKYISPEQYLELEEFSEVRNEYFNGEIFGMAGASERHNTICNNISSELQQQLKKRPCKAYQSEMRVYIEKTGLYTYPDVLAVCGKPELLKYRGLESLTNPLLIIEVLSPSTADYNKGAKFDNYRTLDSLREYVLVWQDKVRVARYTKQKDGSWLLTDFIGENTEIVLSSIECKLLIEDIYDKVDFSE